MRSRLATFAALLVRAAACASNEAGSPNLTVTATLGATEYGVALENRGARPLPDPAVDIVWP